MERIVTGDEDKRSSSNLTARIAALALAEQSRARIAAERNGVALPDSAEVLDRLRAERIAELAEMG
ncbi:MAG TPA: hypothetical protein PKM78_02545 [Anaerolineae bacterium]|nr:hypothetical protein [Anaerolineae bacterium]HNU02757.1 hypothetical protein [Anaerolineae bacterium]